MTRFAALTVLSLLAACGDPAVTGALTNGESGQPIAEMRLVAKAVDDVGLTCLSGEGTTDASGAFTIPNLCTSQTAYTLEPEDQTLFLADFTEIAKGQAGEPVGLKAWIAPSGKGLYLQTGEGFESIATHADLREDRIYGSEETVLYPDATPGKVPKIEGEARLVISGTSNIEEMVIVPLLPSGRRIFEGENGPQMPPWWYLGTEFTTDGEFARKEATLDEAKLLTKTAGERGVRYIPADALPEGRYAIYKPGNRKRISIVDFGTAPELPPDTKDEG